jgi:hypothetical protein
METAYIAVRQPTLLSRLLESEHGFRQAAAIREIEAVQGSAAYRAANRQPTAS